MSIKSLAHVCIRTPDLDRTRNFYCDALGLRKLFDFTKAGNVIGFYLKVSGTSYIEVFKADDTVPPQSSLRLAHFCLETDAIESLREKLAESGFSPGEIRSGADHSFQFWVNDPNGVALEFHQYTDRSAQRTGENVEVNW